MKRVEAIIRPERLDFVRTSLEKLSYPGMMVSEIKGHGKQKGSTQTWRGIEVKAVFLPKIKIELVVADSAVEKVVETIVEVCQSNTVGDGKIFISPVETAVRIRTGEKGDKAI